MKLKNNPYLLAGFFAIVIGGIVFGAIYPLFSHIRDNSRKISSSASEGSSLALQSAQLEAFKKKSDEYQGNMQKIQQAFVDPENPVEFITFLETISTQAGVQTQVHSVSDANTQHGTIDFKISTQGEFLNTLSFFERLEYGPYLVGVKALSVRKPESSEQDEAPVRGVLANSTIEVITRVPKNESW